MMNLKPRAYPILYFDGGYTNKRPSDKDWIMARMAIIPVQSKPEVSEKYESLFQKQGREVANRYLNETAKKQSTTEV